VRGTIVTSVQAPKTSQRNSCASPEGFEWTGRCGTARVFHQHDRRLSRCLLFGRMLNEPFSRVLGVRQAVGFGVSSCRVRGRRAVAVRCVFVPLRAPVLPVAICVWLQLACAGRARLPQCQPGQSRAEQSRAEQRSAGVPRARAFRGVGDVPVVRSVHVKPCRTGAASGQRTTPLSALHLRGTGFSLEPTARCAAAADRRTVLSVAHHHRALSLNACQGGGGGGAVLCSLFGRVVGCSTIACLPLPFEQRPDCEGQ
jgi:hypothetical protein